ncbi:hypothetical protein [Metabacillus sp. FJAT-52054]|uniref:SMI1/KNR4 family protein n=1 Tax=Metabacillus sediminis TaxID=3117746 RepID=A0ABZ2NFT5_9BACI
MLLMEKSISLTTDELAAVLALCGFEDMATDVFNSKEVLMNQDLLGDYAQNIEASLKIKGFWDPERDSSVPEGLENLITLIAHSKKKVRFVSGQEVLFLHQASKSDVVAQYISDGIHHFRLSSIESDIESEMKEFLHINASSADPKLEQLLLTEEIFNQLHTINEEAHEQILQSKVPDSLKRFLEDFKRNHYEFNNLSFLDSNFAQKELNVTSVMFYLIENGYVWWLDYNKVEEDKIYVLPISVKEFMSVIMDALNQYFKR